MLRRRPKSSLAGRPKRGLCQSHFVWPGRGRSWFERWIGLAQVSFQQRLLSIGPIRRIEQLHGEERVSFKHGLRVGKLTKSLDAMIGAHAGVADPSERQVVVEHMPTPIVDRDTAGM